MSRQPDWRLKVFNKVTEARTATAGVAWNNPNGTISLTLNPAVTLTDNPDLSFILFPYEYQGDIKSNKEK